MWGNRCRLRAHVVNGEVSTPPPRAGGEQSFEVGLVHKALARGPAGAGAGGRGLTGLGFRRPGACGPWRGVR